MKLLDLPLKNERGLFEILLLNTFVPLGLVCKCTKNLHLVDSQTIYHVSEYVHNVTE